jgi:hypothetical protein
MLISLDNLHDLIFELTTSSTPSMEISSGPGAPMFEPGPHTRIRRQPVRAFASLTWSGGPREVFGQVVNISPGGCLLKTEASVPVGTTLELSITILGSGQRSVADVRAVARHATTESGRRAFGLEFVAECSKERETLQWLYAQAVQS